MLFLAPALTAILAGSMVSAQADAPSEVCNPEPSRPVIYRSTHAPTNPSVTTTGAPVNPTLAPFKVVPLAILGVEPTEAPSNAPNKSPVATKSPTTSPTSSPTLKAVEGTQCIDKPINICLAIDMSGSICSPINDVGSCRASDDSPCITKCRNSTLTKDICCTNYKRERDFAVDFINRFSSGHIHNSAQRYSLVSFSTDSFTMSRLTASASDMIASVLNLKYWGGSTNTGEAIRMCYDTLKADTTSENVIVLMTDGTPTTSLPGYDSAGHVFYAQTQANNAKNAGMRVATVAIKTGHLQLGTLATLSSGPEYLIGVDSFDKLDMSIVDRLAAVVKCGDSNTVVQQTAAITNVPTMAPYVAPTMSPVPDLSHCGIKDFDICFAIDMSGSICSPLDKPPQQCKTSTSSCISDCQQLGYSKDLCCSNFEKERSFASKFVSTMDSYGGTQRFSVVSFADSARQEISLQEASYATYQIGRLVYTGGMTNTGEAIKSCVDYLSDGSALNKAIVLLTDGLPTVSYSGNSNHLKYAVDQANIAKASGITIMPVAVNTPSTTITNLQALASNNKYVVQVADFSALNVDKVNELVELVKCEPVPQFNASTVVIPPPLPLLSTGSPTAAPQTDSPTFSKPADWVIQGTVSTFETGASGWAGVTCTTSSCVDDTLRVYDTTNCPSGAYCWRLRDQSTGWTSKFYQYYEGFTGAESTGKIVFDFKSKDFAHNPVLGLRVITRCAEYFPGKTGSTDFIQRADLECCGTGPAQFRNDQVYRDWPVEFDMTGCKRVKLVFECMGDGNADNLWIDNIKFYTKSPHAVVLPSPPTVVLSDNFVDGIGGWSCPPSADSYCRRVSGVASCDGTSGSCIRLNGDPNNNQNSQMTSKEFRVLAQSKVKVTFHFETEGMNSGMKLELYYKTMADSTGTWGSLKLFKTLTCGTDFAVGTTTGDVEQLITVPTGARNMVLNFKLYGYVAGDEDQMFIDTIVVSTAFWINCFISFTFQQTTPIFLAPFSTITHTSPLIWV